MVSPQGTDHVLNNVKKRSTCVLIPSYILMDRKKNTFIIYISVVWQVGTLLIILLTMVIIR